MRYILFFLLLFQLNLVTAQFRIIDRNAADENSFPIILDSVQSSIYFDTSDYALVKIAAELLAKDIELATGVKPGVTSDINSLPEYVIIIGTTEKSDLIRKLSHLKKIDFKEIDGQWERFMVKTIRNPLPGVKHALIISGSDRRGTAYGVFELSNAMGVSPWYWWGDVVPEKIPVLIIDPVDFISETPSVKYRGVFLNDEDWGLQPWAAKTFEPETGDIGPKTYARIFELLLRLKANLIWPAMHNCTRAFYHYPANKEVADAYGIIIGTSHAEPMLRNNVDEWDKQTMGNFNYVTNRDAVYHYWEQRAKETKNDENIYTVGMRGIHDSGMEGVSHMKDKVDILEKIIGDQREIIQKQINQDVTKVPQAFIPYKEVLEIYDNGLSLPEDITIVWPDDNYGYIRRLSDPGEQSRSGGGGIYYHLSYWGRPHDYLWLSSTHPLLIWEELYKAYQNRCDRIWVFNVGDIKPIEYNMQLCLDMAYDISSFSAPTDVSKHLIEWHGNLFGNEQGASLGEIMLEYYSLAFERRPEFMGWSQTEPTTATGYTEFNHFFYNDEAQRRIDRYDEITRQVSHVSNSIPVARRDAFFELVYYPVRCAALMNRKFLHHDKSYLYTLQHRSGADDHDRLVRQAYDSIIAATTYYNELLAGGKWNHMMSMNPRNLPVFECPGSSGWKVPDISDWGISIEGNQDEIPKENMYGSALPAFSPWGPDRYFIDVFLSGSGNISWQATVSGPWIKLNKPEGILKNEFLLNEDRIWVSIDWSHVPEGKPANGYITFKGEGREFKVPVSISNPSVGDFTGFVEHNRYLSIFAANYSRAYQTNNYHWQTLNGIGYAGNTMLLLNRENTLQGDSVSESVHASLEYDLYTFSEGNAQIAVYCLPSHALNPQHCMRIAIAVDDSSEQVVDFRTYGRSETWKQNVLRNNAIIQTEHLFSSSGKHTLKITALDPGVMIDRITIDFGGLEPAYSAVPETKTVK